MGSQIERAEEVLVVGERSRLWALLSQCSDLQVKGRSFTAVSSRDIYNLSPVLLQRSFSYAIVFSYSRCLTENMKLLRNLHLLVPDLIYISTCSVMAADKGYPYKYPKVKRETEIFLRDSKLFKGLRIVRLGMVEGSFDSNKVKGLYKYTSLRMIAKEIQRGNFQNRSGVVFKNLYIDLENRFAPGIERICFRAYRRAILWHPVMGGLLRPLDLVCRSLGWHWYGYNCVANYGAKNF